MDNQDRRNEFLEQLPVSRELDEQLDQLMATVENLASKFFFFFEIEPKTN